MSNVLMGNVPSEGTMRGNISTVFGKDGKSAYELAVKNGYKGTEVEWLESLKCKVTELANGVINRIELFSLDFLTKYLSMPMSSINIAGAIQSDTYDSLTETGVYKVGSYAGEREMIVVYRLSNAHIVQVRYLTDKILFRGIHATSDNEFPAEEWREWTDITEDKHFRYATQFYTMEQLKGYGFQRGVTYSFFTSAGVAVKVGAGFCVGAIRPVDGDDCLELFNFSTGVSWRINLTSGAVEKLTETVPDWAKQDEKPTYTAEEVGALSKDDTAVKQTVAAKLNVVNLSWDWVEQPEKYPRYILDAIREGNSPFNSSEFRGKNLTYYIDNGNEGEFFIFENFYSPTFKMDIQRITMFPDDAFHGNETIVFLGHGEAGLDMGYSEINSRPLEEKVENLENTITNKMDFQVIEESGFESYDSILEAIRNGKSPFDNDKFRGKNAISFVNCWVGNNDTTFIVENYATKEFDVQRITLISEGAMSPPDPITFMGFGWGMGSMNYQTEFNYNETTRRIENLESSLGDIDTTLANIIALQENYIGGVAE